MSSSHRLAYFPGNCALFNLKAVVRLKGNDLAVAAERWDNHEDYPLVVRLLSEESGVAWMIGHWGYKEIFRSPIFMPVSINATSTTVVHVMLHQWTRRKKDPITRQFCLSFGCEQFALAFVIIHNRILSKMQQTKLGAVAVAEDEEDRSAGEDEEDRSVGEDEEDGSAAEVSEEDEEYTFCGGHSQDPFADYISMPDTQDPFADYISD